MSQDSRIPLECTECKSVTHFSSKNKKIHKEKLEIQKHCRFCKKHTLHKETKFGKK